MLKGKNLWIALGVGAVAYYLWMQKKKKQAVSAPAAATNFTGDLDVPQYQNASGVPRFGKAAMYPSGQNALGRKLSGF